MMNSSAIGLALFYTEVLLSLLEYNTIGYTGCYKALFDSFLNPKKYPPSTPAKHPQHTG